jgi:chromosome segregation ATPase
VANALDKFTELENKVFRIVELFRTVKLQKESLEKDLLKSKSQMEQSQAEIDRLKVELQEYRKEKDLVRDKVESMLKNLEKLTL